MPRRKRSTQPPAHVSVRLDLASGVRLGPGKIVLLEAIKSTGSITAAAKSIGMSYRKAWLLVDEINQALREPAVTASAGGNHGGGTIVTPVGEDLIGLYHAIEAHAGAAAANEFQTISKLASGGGVASA